MAYRCIKFDHSAVPEIWLVPQKNFNGSRDLTTPLSVMICYHLLRSTYLPNLNYLSPPTTKIWKAIENIENRVVWGSYGSLKVTENSAIW